MIPNSSPRKFFPFPLGDKEEVKNEENNRQGNGDFFGKQSQQKEENRK